VYRVVVKATDANGVSAYLQLVAVANGTITTGGNASSTTKQKVVTVTKTQILLWPSMVAIPLILLTFWIGRRYELLSIRKRIENSTSGDY
jgi:glucan phosphoethanolaminetransferase (alkaline phosphatase superfamily)